MGELGRTRFSYANVVASLALFISLGGVSYAAFSLPANSVGARNLRAGAVDTRALGFPLGASSASKDTPEDLPKGACNGAVRPGEIPPPCSPSILGGPSGTLLRTNTLHPGHLLISSVAGLDNANATDAEVSYAVIVDDRAVSVRRSTLAGGQQEQVPIQALVSVGRGSHTVGFQASAEYSSYGPGDVIVAPVSIVAVSLP